MSLLLKNLEKAEKFYQDFSTVKPKLAVILGTGLGNIVDSFDVIRSIGFSEIPGFVTSTAPTHAGKLHIAKKGTAHFLLMQGRLHLYEGYTINQITYPIRFFRYLGIEQLFITNASGSLRKDFCPGDLVVIKDHINFTGQNPLVGKNEDYFGDRFTSLNEPYNLDFQKLLMKIAEQNNITLKKGVYIGVLGPNFESRSECIMFERMGADIVGMSTVPEVLVGLHCSMKIAAVSCISNYSNIFHDKPHSIEDINEATRTSEQNLRLLISGFIDRILASP